MATGCTFAALELQFRMHYTTVGLIVKAVSKAIWRNLVQIHMPAPTVELLRQIATKNYQLWGFPNCAGGLDSKHIKVICPDNSGSMNYNYKNFFSTVLQGVADGDYKFVCIDVGGYGRQSDGGTFSASDLYKNINNGSFLFPEPEFLPETQVEAPFVLVGDEAYPLLSYLLRPYGGKGLDGVKKHFNDRLSRIRKCIECAFGILRAKWRILATSIDTSLETADDIVKALCLLHNVIIDLEGMDHNLIETDIFPAPLNRQKVLEVPTDEGHSVRNLFTSYFENNPLIHM